MAALCSCARITCSGWLYWLAGWLAGWLAAGTSQGIDKQWERDSRALSCESLKAAVRADGGTEISAQAALGQVDGRTHHCRV